MDFNETAEKLLNDSKTVNEIVATLTETQLADFVSYLKEQVEAYWWSDAKLSLHYADAIIAVGECSHNKRHHALGLMARGDTLRFLGELVNAWDALTQAADMFNEVNDEVGWARTCVGRLALCTDLHHVDATLEDAFKARIVLKKNNETDKLIRLETGVAYVYLLQGRYSDALDVIFPAIDIAESIGEEGKPRLRHLYHNAAYALMFLTRFDEAKNYYEAAQKIFEEAGDLKGVATTKINIAYMDEKRGHYRDALRHHHQAMNILKNNFPYHWAVSALDAIRCYCELNRYVETYTLIKEVEAIFVTQNANVYLAQTLEIFAIILAQGNRFEEAIKALYQAVDLYKAQNATERLQYVDLRLAEILYFHGMLDEALVLAENASKHFEKTDIAHYCTALLVSTKIYYAKSRWQQASKSAQFVESLARKYGLSPLRYQAHLLLGEIAQKTGNYHRAIRRFRAANATINRLQQRLTMTLRSDFLLDKSDAFHSLIELLLLQNQVENAFEEIERHKSQVFWHYLLSNDKFAWKVTSQEMQELVEELEQFRAVHHWYYHLLNHPDDRGNYGLNDSELRSEILQYEARIRYITEKLAIYSETSSNTHFAQLPDFNTIKARLADNTLLVEYYIANDAIYIFTLFQGQLQVCTSPIPVRDIRSYIEQFQFNVDSALKVGRTSPISKQLSRITNNLLKLLYDALCEPVASQINLASNLIVVPFGVLHYVPFHLLQSQDAYMFESHPISILPSSSFLVRESRLNAKESLVLGYSHSNELVTVHDEAKQVHAIIGGRLALDDAVNKTILTENSGLILHIAAHGEFRFDQAELSFIELSDGQLMADDLHHLDMNYSLVTLSACETGRAHIASADEMIGLGRGFLYGGAASLLASLWRAEDELTKHVMIAFYTHLYNGMDKAQALQQAYKTVYRQYPEQHVAFWGAFQLIGDISPIFDKS